MKYLFLVTLLVSLFCFSLAAECTADWECGNPVYFDCIQQQACTILYGVGTAPGQVFWAERCQEGVNNTAVYVVRADDEGVQRVITVPETSGGKPATTVRLVDSNSVAVYVGKEVSPYADIAGYSVEGEGYSEEFSAFLPRSEWDFKMAFDEPNEITFGCWHPYYGIIIRYESLNISSSVPHKTVYKAITCNALAYGDNSIFWSQVIYNYTADTYTTAFFRGNPDCDDCDPPSPFTIAPGRVRDFELDNGRIYYTVEHEGLKFVDLANPDWANAQVLVAANNISTLSIRDGRVFYNEGTAIKAVNVDGSNPATISVSSPTAKQCVCSSGFSGENCQECPEGQIQWSEGKASCVPYNALGFPQSCSADYMCGNVPYAKCNAQKQCECATGSSAIPPACDTCLDGYIAWNNGVPSCTAN